MITLALGKVGIPQETLPCQPLLVFGVGNKTLRIF